MNSISKALSIAIVIAAMTGAALLCMKSCAKMPGDAVASAGDALMDTAVRGGDRAIDLGKRIVDGLARRLQIQPEIKIDRETRIECNRAVLELTTLKRDFTHEYVWEHQWAGSRKKITLKGDFTAAVGFDLNESFYINIHSQDLRVDLKFPEPRLLSCELIHYEAEVKEGWWNKISEEERAKALNELIASAKRSIEQSGDLQHEARRMLELQVADVITQQGGTLGYANDDPFPQPIR